MHSYVLLYIAARALFHTCQLSATGYGYMFHLQAALKLDDHGSILCTAFQWVYVCMRRSRYLSIDLKKLLICRSSHE